MMNFEKLIRGSRSHLIAMVIASGYVSIPANAFVLTVQPEQPQLQNSCLAFGAGGFDPVLPFMGLMYRNLPDFDLAPGDTLAFDLSDVNEADIEIDIEIAEWDPVSLESGPFTKIVSNTQTPANPRGDVIFGNYELEFEIEAPFNFSALGMVLRFSNPSPDYAKDDTCTQVGVTASPLQDTSDQFAGAFFGDSDGLAPWSNIDFDSSLNNGFQIRTLERVSIDSKVKSASGGNIARAAVGANIVFRILVDNRTQTDATGVTVLNALPSDVEFLGTTTAPSAAAVFEAGPPATVTWSVGALAAGDDARLDIDVSVKFEAAGKTLTNTAEVTESDPPLATGQATTATIDIDEFGQDILSNGGDGNCFIATAAYGSYLAPEVLELRRFRDEWLLTNRAGQAFVNWYYRVSPPLAAALQGHAGARFVVRIALSPIVYAIKYPLPALALILACLLLTALHRRANSAAL